MGTSEQVPSPGLHSGPPLAGLTEVGSSGERTLPQVGTHFPGHSPTSCLFTALQDRGPLPATGPHACVSSRALLFSQVASLLLTAGPLLLIRLRRQEGPASHTL